jgi:signal transduction histidine kinase
LEKVGQILQAAIAQARQLSHELSPPVLKHVSLFASLKWLVRRFKEQFNLSVDLETHAVQNIENETLKLFLFRALQELLFNVVKHAGVNCARVELSDTSGCLILSVMDQGRGFNPAHLDGGVSKTTGLGLRSLRERASYMGGRLTIESASGQGCCFILTLPADLVDNVARKRRITDQVPNPRTMPATEYHHPKTSPR